MTNATTQSTRSEQRNNVSVITIVCLIGLAVFSVLAFLALFIWSSPIVFFTVLAGAFFCIDPLRALR